MANRFKTTYDEVKYKRDALNIEISGPRRTNVRINCRNVQANSSEDPIGIFLFNAFIDLGRPPTGATRSDVIFHKYRVINVCTMERG